MDKSRLYQNLSSVQSAMAQACQEAGREPHSVQLLPVTKTVDAATIGQLYDEGLRHFGENRLDVLESKVGLLPDDITWHFIGHLQRKKVRKVVALCDVIHSIDSLKLAQKVSEIATDMGRIPSIYLELNNGEAQKGGFTQGELLRFLPALADLPNLRILGLMIMAPLTDDKAVLRDTFSRCASLQEKLNNTDCVLPPFTQLSMGMSNDYPVAISCGSTLVRVGSALYSE